MNRRWWRWSNRWKRSWAKVFLNFCPSPTHVILWVSLKGSNCWNTSLWVWLKPKSARFFHAIELFQLNFSGFLAQIRFNLAWKFLEASRLICKGWEWFEKVLKWCEHLWCTSSGDSGLISSTLCTLNSKPKDESHLANFIYHFRAEYWLMKLVCEWEGFKIVEEFFSLYEF